MVDTVFDDRIICAGLVREQGEWVTPDLRARAKNLFPLCVECCSTSALLFAKQEPMCC